MKLNEVALASLNLNPIHHNPNPIVNEMKLSNFSCLAKKIYLLKVKIITEEL